MATNARFRHHSNLTFPLLSDAAGKTAAAFGLWWTLPPAFQDALKQTGVYLPDFNADSTWALPMPARYVIGQDGVIAYAELYPDYTQRGDPAQVLPVVDALSRARSAA